MTHLDVLPGVMPSIDLAPHRAMRRSLSLVTTGAFWAGTLFPVLYLPVVVGNHPRTGNDLLFALVGLHLLLLFVGHRHLQNETELATAESEESPL